MSSSQFHDLVERALALTRAICSAAELPHQEAIGRARQNIADAERSVSAASECLGRSIKVLQQVRLARKTSSDRAVVDALAAAEAHRLQAFEEETQAHQNRHTAQRQLVIALGPIQVYMAIARELEALRIARIGSAEEHARAALFLAAASLEWAKEQHPEFAAAEANVVQANQALAQLQLDIQQAARANSSLQLAVDTMPTSANQKAVEATGLRLATAEMAAEAAQQALTAAAAALKLALQPIRSHEDLYAAVLSALLAAKEIDAAFRTEKEQLKVQQQRERSARGGRISDLCTCSALAYPCSYCRNE